MFLLELHVADSCMEHAGKYTLGSPPTQDAIVTTRMITFLVGGPKNISLSTVTATVTW